jgi:hypothetical protein
MRAMKKQLTTPNATYARAFGPLSCTCTHVCAYACACAYVCARVVYVRACVYGCVRTCVCAYVCACAYVVHAHVKGLKTPSSWCLFSKERASIPSCLSTLRALRGGLEGVPGLSLFMLNLKSLTPMRALRGPCRFAI